MEIHLPVSSSGIVSMSKLSLAVALLDYAAFLGEFLSEFSLFLVLFLYFSMNCFFVGCKGLKSSLSLLPITNYLVNLPIVW